MQLKPKRPPGRAGRKAWQYASEIQRLRAEGYSMEAIRLALLDVGVAVSYSTVRREAARGLSAPACRSAVDPEAAAELREADHEADPLSESENLARLVEEFLELPNGTAAAGEYSEKTGQEKQQPRFFKSWLMRLLHGARRTG